MKFFTYLIIFSSLSIVNSYSSNTGKKACRVNEHTKIPIIFNKNYNDARKILISSGWQPILARWQDKEQYASSGNGPELWKVGYTEVRHCFGTGAAGCHFVFRDSYENILNVYTSGELI